VARQDEEEKDELHDAQTEFQALVLQPQINFRNLDSYKFDLMTKFERTNFLKFERKHRHYVSRCAIDNVALTPLHELFPPTCPFVWQPIT
jgi:hypothetical protein